MKVIHGLCGTHGTGKSTIINGLAAQGVKVDRTQLSRTAQRILGWDSLADALNNAGTMWQLQNAILDALIQRDFMISEATNAYGSEVVFVERTPADIWAYTKVWCGRLGINISTDINALEYKSHLLSVANAYYKNLFFIPMSDKVPFVEEPNRADLASREPVQSEILSFCSSNNLPLRYVFMTGAQDRVDEIMAKM